MKTGRKKSSKRVPWKAPLYRDWKKTLFDDLDNTVMFYITLITFARESIEVSTCGDVVS
jgi:hypothetical protein